MGFSTPSDVGLTVMKGLDEIREKLIPIERGVRMHHGMNPAIISVGDDGIVKMRSKYIVAGERGFISFGEYEDDCVKTDKGWRIRYRKTRRIAAFKTEGMIDAPRFGDVAPAEKT